jgi:hypothetical protein
MTRRATIVAGLVTAALWSGAAVSADEWDRGNANDDGPNTDNGLASGTEQTHDLATSILGLDEDWFRVASRQFSSYELAIDGVTTDLDLGPTSVQHLDAAGVAFEDAFVSEPGVLSLRWLQAEATPAAAGFVRVRGAACGASCDASDRYRVRFYDTTYTVPRFNNSGTQTTVLLLQNASARDCAIRVHFLGEAGGLVGQFQYRSVSPQATAILPTATVVPGLAGSMRIAHTCGYGGLSGKAVALEPATGFTFDTPLVHVPG